MYVFQGLDPRAQIAVDAGAKRTVADSLRWAGFVLYAVDAAAMARIIINYDEGAVPWSDTQYLPNVTGQEAVDWMLDNADEAIESIRRARAAYDSNFPTPSIAALSAALCIIGRVDPNGAAKMAQDMADLRMDGRGDPLHTLHKKMRAVQDGERTPPAALVYLYLRT